MKTMKAAQITCSVYRSFTGNALNALHDLGVKNYHFQASRAIVLRRRRGFMGIMAGIVLEVEPADRIIFFVPPSFAGASIQKLVAACNLVVPGRGSVICEEADIAMGCEWQENALTSHSGSGADVIQKNLVGISCIVVKGQGNSIAHAVLGLGIPMPLVTTGIGMGVRDKLGLIRIALPAEKEVVHTIVSGHEANGILDSLITTGKLDRVGSGFIYASPIQKGVINSMVIRGQRHSASIEQIIAAVDDLKGSADWRKRLFEQEGKSRKRSYMRDLVNLTVICNEGRANDLVQAAMGAGASGATISRLSYACSDDTRSSCSPAREISELIVGKGMVDTITKALEDEGVFDEETAGFVALKPVTMAFTHKGSKS